MLKPKPSILKKISLFLVLVTIFSILTSLPVSAANKIEVEYEDEKGKEKTVKIEDLNGNGKISIDEVNAYAKDELGTIKYGIYWVTHWGFLGSTSLTDSFASWFKSDGFTKTDKGEDTKAVVMMENIKDGLLVIGQLLCFLYFLLELMDQATRDSFTIESFIKAFAKLIIMFVLFGGITIGGEEYNVMTVISDFGAASETQLIEIINSGNQKIMISKLVAYVKLMDKNSWLKCIGFLFENSFSSITMLVSTLVVGVVSFGRAIELLVYESLLPLGMASIYNGGLNSSGFRYLKKWLALYVQGAIMLATVYIGHYLADGFKTIVGLASVMDLFFAIGTAMIIARSKSIANDVMGV